MDKLEAGVNKFMEEPTEKATSKGDDLYSVEDQGGEGGSEEGSLANVKADAPSAPSMDLPFAELGDPSHQDL